ERKGSNFFFPSNSFAKKKFSFFSAPSALPERRYSFKAGANIELLFLPRKHLSKKNQTFQTKIRIKLICNKKIFTISFIQN
ncbi:MAG: hypothetical protein AB7S48_12655, partial [Bacteroidales bacterium]